jgi:hypothetical protein
MTRWFVWLDGFADEATAEVHAQDGEEAAVRYVMNDLPGRGLGEPPAAVVVSGGRERWRRARFRVDRHVVMAGAVPCERLEPTYAYTAEPAQ